MIERLGNVLYWTACLAALGWVAIVFAATTGMKPEPEWSLFWAVGFAPGVIIWAAGRAVRYVLAGR